MIQTGRKDGMQLMDQAILDYLMKKVVSAQEAHAMAHSKTEFLPCLPAESQGRDGRPTCARYTARTAG
jgi:twitching motility protein PilT